MAWKTKVYQTNYNTVGAYVEDEDTGITIHLKSPEELGISHMSRRCGRSFISECTSCKHKLQMEANKIASMLNGFTDEVEV